MQGWVKSPRRIDALWEAPARLVFAFFEAAKSGWFLQSCPVSGMYCVEALRTGQSFAPPRRRLIFTVPPPLFLLTYSSGKGQA